MSLLNLVNDVAAERLIPDAYFQRNLVWRDIHKKDFIKTILLGYPFPQIFISKGKVDVETRSTVSCIVDGQQRTNAISSFIDNGFEVDGKFYSDLSEEEKSKFLKYEIAVIELDLENDDPRVLDIFQRINRTSNSLTMIEKLASEYSSSEYMLTAKLLTDQVELEINPNADFKEDPNIPKEFFDWAKTKNLKSFIELITKRNIFTAREIARKAHLFHVLNMMSSHLGGIYNRNELTHKFLNDYAQEFNEKDILIEVFEKVAYLILQMRLKKTSYWYNKSNIFTLVIELAEAVKLCKNINIECLAEQLLSFEQNVPDDYKLAATEAVNNKKERLLRSEYVRSMLEKCIQ